MNKEIERKFLVKTMPDLTGLKVEDQERYFLELGDVEKRITRIDDKYIYEEKEAGNGASAKKITGIITKDEFGRLKELSIKSLNRKSYVLSKNPEISIKIYEGEYEGLIRAEFEFNSEIEARNFVPPEWIGREITDTKLGRDGKLVNLSRNDYLNILKKINGDKN